MAPPVTVDYAGKRYPHRYLNKEQLLPPGSFYEFSSKPYPYEYQNSKGIVRKEFPENPTYPDKGYTRTITDRNKNIQGVFYHPVGAPDPVTGVWRYNNTFQRAETVLIEKKKKCRVC
jgi:hypothetical protein